jgi:MFS family permease
MNWGEFRDGWRILLLGLLGIAISINAILLYGFGTLTLPLEQAFGWSRSDQQAAITFLYGGAVIGLQAVGWLNVRWGIRRITVLSLLLLALGYLACAQWLGGPVWTLYLAFGLLPIVGMGALAITWTQLISLWFIHHRGLALAIGLSGTGITAALVPGLLAALIEQHGWQAAFISLALLNLLLIPLALGWLQLPQPVAGASAPAAAVTAGIERAAQAQLGLAFKQGVVSGRYWVCNLAICLVVAAVIGMVTNTVPILRERGFSATEAGVIFSGFGVALIGGRLLVGFFLDRLWPPAVAAVSLLLPSLGCLLLLVASNDMTTMIIAVALIGIGTGAEFDIAAFLIARYFGMKDYSRLMGLHQGLVTVASALAPLLFAILYRESGNYQMMLMLCVGFTAAGALLLLTLGRAPQFALAAPAPA